MRCIKYLLAYIFLFLFITAFVLPKKDWGFFVHRRINRLAVFTLPVDLISFYKKHIEYVTAHATDPDMRRYVIPIEGQKHFIDLDYWKNKTLPRNFLEARQRFTQILIINENGDSLRLDGIVQFEHNQNVVLKGQNLSTFLLKDSLVLLAEDYEHFFKNQVYNPIYVDNWTLDCDRLVTFFDEHGFQLDCHTAVAVDSLVEHGVLPYNLIRMQHALKYAMLEKDLDKILRISSDLGHYIGDAYVPLHTHSNYNGQQTDQLGIHAFWETRLPEMFADETYDYFVGQATYIEDIETYYWNIILESHALAKDVLSIEKELSESFPKDQQICFVERGEGFIQKMACEEYAALYHQKLNGQVEYRLRGAIKSVGDAWFTAWVDAGQPALAKILDNRNVAVDLEKERKLRDAAKSQPIIGRKH